MYQFTSITSSQGICLLKVSRPLFQIWLLSFPVNFSAQLSYPKCCLHFTTVKTKLSLRLKLYICNLCKTSDREIELLCLKQISDLGYLQTSCYSLVSSLPPNRKLKHTSMLPLLHAHLHFHIKSYNVYWLLV